MSGRRHSLFGNDLAVVIDNCSQYLCAADVYADAEQAVSSLVELELNFRGLANPIEHKYMFYFQASIDNDLQNKLKYG